MPAKEWGLASIIHYTVQYIFNVNTVWGEEGGNKSIKNQVWTLHPLQNRESKLAEGEIILVKITGKKFLLEWQNW